MTVCHLLKRLEPSYLAASQCGREAEGAVFHCLNLWQKQSGIERERYKKNSSHTRREYKELKKRHYLMMESDETPSWNVCQHADSESHLTLTPRGECGWGGNGLKLESFIETSMTEESCLRWERDCVATHWRARHGFMGMKTEAAAAKASLLQPKPRPPTPLTLLHVPPRTPDFTLE